MIYRLRCVLVTFIEKFVVTVTVFPSISLPASEDGKEEEGDGTVHTLSNY